LTKIKINYIIIVVLLIFIVFLINKQNEIQTKMETTEHKIRTKELAIDSLKTSINSYKHTLTTDSIEHAAIIKEDSLSWAKKLRQAKKLTSKERLDELVGNVKRTPKDSSYSITNEQINKVFDDVLHLKMQNSKLGLENAQLSSLNENRRFQVASYESIVMNYEELEFLENNLKKQIKAKHRKQLLRVGGIALGAGLIIGLML
jgi:hypothetical protein